jgi:hypothetical protein
MKYIKSAIIALISIATINCSDSTNRQTLCDSSNTEFNQIYNSILSLPTNGDGISFPTEVHAYKFEVTSAKTVCSIGYQSIPTMETTPYRIELYNNTTNILLYSGEHTFSASSTSYVSIGSIPLTVGNSYTIKRIQTNWGSDINNAMGRDVEGEIINYAFPLSIGALTITSSQFGSEEYVAMLPYIDIVFEQ